MTSWILGRKFENLGHRSVQQAAMLENEVKRDGEGKMKMDAKEEGMTSSNRGLIGGGGDVKKSQTPQGSSEKKKTK